jgi:hypothetical protein
MWPFLGGNLRSVDATLQVPGQDSQASVQQFGNNSVYCGIRFNGGTGDFEYRLSSGGWTTFSPTWDDMWIHSDMKDPDIFNVLLYEARVVNVAGDPPDGSFTYGTTGYGADDFWHDVSLTPNWWIRVTQAFDVKEFTCLVQIREKANHANIKTGDMKVRAVELGF